MPSIESAPASIPATSAIIFTPALAPLFVGMLTQLRKLVKPGTL